MDDDLGGVPSNLIARNSLLEINQLKGLKKSSSLSSLSLSRSSSISSLGSLNLPKRPSSLTQIAHAPSLSSIPEEDFNPNEKHLKWGFVEEYGLNSDCDSRSSSRAGDDTETAQQQEEEDGWGWFSEDAATASTTTNRTSAAFPPSTSDMQAPKAAAAAPVKKSRSMLKILSEPTPIFAEPLPSNNNNNGLLILGTKLWPQQRQVKRRRLPLSSVPNPSPSMKPVSSSVQQDPQLSSSSTSWLRATVLEAKKSQYPVFISAAIIFGRGMSMGYVLRFVPNVCFRLVSYFYAMQVASNHAEALRTGMFLGSSMSIFHIFAMNNVSEEDDEGNNSEDDDDDEEASKQVFRVPWVTLASLCMTPLLGFLPRTSRLSMALFVTARAVESLLNRQLLRLPQTVRKQLPISSWLFSLGSAQIVYLWLFFRSALPGELASFLDQASSLNPSTMNFTSLEDFLKRLKMSNNKEPLLKRVALGSGLFELVASDVFSCACLFGPVFDLKNPSLRSALWRSSRAALVLILTAIFSRIGLVALSRLLRRFSFANGFYAGFLAGLVAIQGETEETRRVELAMFSLTFAVRSLFNLAAQRNMVPEKLWCGEFALYFSSLTVLLHAANQKDSTWFVVGNTFRTLVRRCILV